MTDLFEAHDTPPKPDAEKPHYHGHRDRVRQKFLDNGADSFADYELLEMILFSAIPRKDVKPIAKTLIAKFEGLTGVLNAGAKELQDVAGVSENTAILLKAIQNAGHRLLKQELIDKPILNSWSRLLEYCQTTMAYEKNEQFRVLFLNKKNLLIADEVQQRGTVDHTPAYPREIVKRALELGATAVILVHNHPSGDATPSDLDIQITQAIVKAADTLNIVVHDHIIVAKGSTTSFRTQGYL